MAFCYWGRFEMSNLKPFQCQFLEWTTVSVFGVNWSDETLWISCFLIYSFSPCSKSHLSVICLCTCNAKKLTLALISTVLEGRQKQLEPDVDPRTSGKWWLLLQVKSKQYNCNFMLEGSLFASSSQKNSFVKTFKDCPGRREEINKISSVRALTFRNNNYQ